MLLQLICKAKINFIRNKKYVYTKAIEKQNKTQKLNVVAPEV